MKNLLTCLTLCCLCFATHGANTWYVAANGDDANNDGKSWDHPFATIQKGLSSCANKDTVIVSNGTYIIDSQLEITAEQVNLMSLTGNPADVIIDCRECRGIFSNSWKSRIVGVTVQNGLTDTAGAGIRLSTSALVSNCVVRSCSVVAGDNDANGGGIMCQQDSDVVGCLVENCIVSNASMTATARDAKGGGIFNIGTVRGCTVRNCAVYSRNGNYGTSAGGGIYVESRIGTDAQYPASVIDCTVYSNKVATLTKTYASEGGGIYIYAKSEIETPQVVSNCNVFANAAGWVGGGVSLFGKAQLLDCTVSSNRMDNTLGLLDPQIEIMGGGGVFACGTGGEIRRCLIEGNESVITGGSKQPQGGGGIRLSGTETRVADCVIRGNYSNTRGAAVYFGTTTSKLVFSDGTISNCWIEANRAESSAIIAGNAAGGLQIVGCALVSNQVANSAALYWYRTEAFPAGVLFRNTLFRGNISTDTGSVYGLVFTENGVTAPVTFEYCSFINEKFPNATGGGTLVMKNAVATATAGNVTVRGCLFYGDSSHARTCIGATTATTGNTVVNTRSKNAPVDDPSLGNFNETTDPCFVDAANGDFRLARNSPLVDKGGAAQAWMGQEGQKNGPMDLGDGTVTLTKSADYGVNVAFNNASPRLSNGLPDIGCFEFYRALEGFMIFVR